MKTSPVPFPGSFVTFIDVGKGDSTLVRSLRTTALIDSGEPQYGPSLIDTLRSSGVGSIDLLVVSHAHIDHMGAMQQVVDAFPVSELIVSSFVNGKEDVDIKGLAEIVRRKGGRVSLVTPGDQRTADGLSIYFYAPLRDYRGSFNNSSMVMSLVLDSVTYLFTGDIKQEAEQDVMDTWGRRLRAHVLKASHHGTSNTTSGPFLDLVSPLITAILCNQVERPNQPGDELLERLRQRGIRYFATDRDGNTTMFRRGSKLHTISSRSGKQTTDELPPLSG